MKNTIPRAKKRLKKYEERQKEKEFDYGAKTNGLDTNSYLERCNLMLRLKIHIHKKKELKFMLQQIESFVLSSQHNNVFTVSNSFEKFTLTAKL